MRKLVLAALVVPLALLGAVDGAEAQTATQSVTMEVDSISTISVSGNPSNLLVNSATAGSNPDDATNSSTSWAVTTNLSSQKLTASVGTSMPTGVTLNLNMSAPTGGTSSGDVSLSTTAADAVTGITELAESALGITYTLSATPSAGVVAQTTKTVTLTLTNGV